MRTARNILIAISAGSPLSVASAQSLDVLPDPSVGGVAVRLDVLTTGLGGSLFPINTNGPDAANFPTDACVLPDGTRRLLVITLDAKIYVIDEDASRTLFHDLLDPLVTEISPRFYGPISIAAHPDFKQNGRFYTIETELQNTGTPDFRQGSDHQDVLYEYAMADPSANSLSQTAFVKRELLRVQQPHRDHNMNDIAFMADGTMLVALGDGQNTGAAGDAEGQLRSPDPSEVFGKIIRIDPLGSDGRNGAYGIPADNPFAGIAGALPEIYTLGHRNPFRVTIDSLTAEIWVGEVGQRTVEEFNVLRPGQNYGWPRKEGSFLFGVEAGDVNGNGGIDNNDVAPDPDLDANGTGDFADTNNFIDPIFEYDHGTGASATGGFVYRGALIPALAGAYIFGDADPEVPGGLFYGDPASGPIAGQTGDIHRFEVDPAGAPAPLGVVSIVPDPDGEPLLLTIEGEILRMTRACLGDLTAPFGQLDIADVVAFLGAFGSLAPIADFAAPRGQFDIADVVAFLGAFGQGCP